MGIAINAGIVYRSLYWFSKPRRRVRFPLPAFMLHYKHMYKKLILGLVFLIFVIFFIYIFINPTRFNDPNKGYSTAEEALLNYPWANQVHSKLSYNGYSYTSYKLIFNIWDLEYSAYEVTPTRVNYRFNPTVDGEKALTFVTVEKLDDLWYVTGAGSGP